MNRTVVCGLLFVLVVSGLAAQTGTWRQDTSLHHPGHFLAVMLFRSNGEILLGGDSTGLYRKRSPIASWERVNWPSDSITIYALAELGPDTIIVGTEWSGILRSTNGMRTWDTAVVPMYFPRVYDGIVDHEGVLYAAATDGGLRSTNRGTTWTTISGVAGITDTAYSDIVRTIRGTLIAGLTISVFDGTLPTLFRFKGGVARSTDNGSTWTKTIMDSLVSVVAEGSDGRLYIGGPDVIGFSDNDGQTWTVKPTPGITFLRMAFEPATSTIYAGTLRGLLRSSDNGETWQDELVGNTTGAVPLLARSPSGVWYVGDVFGRLYVRENVAASTVSARNAGMPVSVDVTHAATSGIRCVVEEGGAAFHSIIITNVAGAAVRELREKWLGPSVRDVEICLDDCPSGLYLYRIETTNGTTSGCFVIAR